MHNNGIMFASTYATDDGSTLSQRSDSVVLYKSISSLGVVSK